MDAFDSVVDSIRLHEATKPDESMRWWGPAAFIPPHWMNRLTLKGPDDAGLVWLDVETPEGR